MEDNTEQIGVIRGRKRGPDGKFIGKFDVNPILDTSVYEIEFEDGRVKSYFSNQLVECILDEREVNANSFTILMILLVTGKILKHSMIPRLT